MNADRPITPSRRGILTGLAAVFAAPAIIRADNLMRLNPALQDWREVFVGFDFTCTSRENPDVIKAIAMDRLRRDALERGMRVDDWGTFAPYYRPEFDLYRYVRTIRGRVLASNLEPGARDFDHLRPLGHY